SARTSLRRETAFCKLASPLTVSLYRGLWDGPWRGGSTPNPGRDVLHDLGRNMARLLLFPWIRFALSGNEKVIQFRITVEGHVRPAGHCFFPQGEVLHGDLIVAFALEDEHRHLDL